MTTPNQGDNVLLPPSDQDLQGLLGQGAYTVSDSGSFGQSVTEDSINSLVYGPLAPANVAANSNSLTAVVSVMGNMLATIPISTLRYLKPFIAGATDADFADSATASAFITNAFIPKQVVDAVNWVTRLITDAEILFDFFHLTYPAGSPTDTKDTEIDGKRTYHSAWADLMDLLGVTTGANPRNPAPGIGSGIANLTDWITRGFKDLEVLFDVFHIVYEAGTPGDAPGTLGTNGKPTWYSAWNDVLQLIGLTSGTTPTTPAPTIGAAIATNTSALSSLNTSLGDLNTEFGNSSAAFAALVASWYTTLTTTGQSWSDVLTALDSAWTTYISANSAVNVSISATLTQIFTNLFGFDPTTGSITSNNVDGLADSFNQLGAAISGDVADSGDWAWLAQLMSQFYSLLGITHTTTVDNANTIANQNNKPLAYGLDDTTESNIAFAQATTAVSTVSNQTLITFVRCQQASTKNTLAFVASGNSGALPSVLIAIFHKMDFVNGTTRYIGNSSNLASQITTSKKWLLVPTGGIAVNPGDVLAIGFESDTVPVKIWGTTGLSGTPVHPTAQLPALAATLAGSTTFAVDTAFTSLTFENDNVPYVALEVSSPPPPTFGDVSSTFTSIGTTTQVLDPWVAFVDLIVVGSGGGGEGETGAGNGPGGCAGGWATQTLTVGTDIVAGGTLTITVGAGGAGGPYFTPGDAGVATTISWHDPGGTLHTLTGAAGLSGRLTNNVTSFGLSPGNETFNGVTYPGGAEVFTGKVGNVPGGGGSGGYAFQYGFAGGRGQAWTVARQT